MKNDKPYKMTISRTTIDKLGVKLYDKVSAVVAEVIANAYDADATEVDVEIPLGQYLAFKSGDTIIDKKFQIKIIDNGHGMVPQEINAFYLPVGKDRREDPKRGATSRTNQRAVMGRKGIGKLAPFGICRTIEVLSSGGEKTKEGYLTAHLILEYESILQETDEPYYPIPGKHDQTYRTSTGTTIVLRDFLYKKIPQEDAFHRQIAARFGIKRPDWVIRIVDSLSQEQGFVIGDLEISLLEGARIEVDERPVILEDGTKLPVTGWVGVSKEAYKDEIMAGIRVYARGKIVAQTRDFDIPSGFTGEHTIRSYLVGVINADWLDADDGDDLIRSDRQDILWSSERGAIFQQWGRDIIRELGNKSESSRRQQAWAIFREKSGIEENVRKVFQDDTLRRSVLKVANIIARTTSRDNLDNPEHVRNIVDLAFSLGPHSAIVETLREISLDADSPFEALVNLFTQARIAETYSLGQIAVERVRAVENLEAKLGTAQDEAELQKLLEDTPWLIDSKWTVLAHNQTLETFRQAFERWYKGKYGQTLYTTAIEYKTKRPDFILMSFGNTLQVVELKKPGHSFNESDFIRMHRYYLALTDFLEKNPEFVKDFPARFQITLVCDSVSLSEISRTAYKLLETSVLTQISWEVFLSRTKKDHQAFLSVTRIQPAS